MINESTALILGLIILAVFFLGAFALRLVLRADDWLFEHAARSTQKGPDLSQGPTVRRNCN